MEETSKGLVGVSSAASLDAEKQEGAICGESSKTGCSLSYTLARVSEVREAQRRHERWRLKMVEMDRITDGRACHLETHRVWCATCGRAPRRRRS